MELRKSAYRSWIIVLCNSILLIVFLISCQKPVEERARASKLPEVILEKETANGKYPYKRLSTYGFFAGKLNSLNPSSSVTFYKPASSLFTDNAFKSRFVYVPEGEKAQIEGEDLNLPKGSILIKNFYYPSDFRKSESERKIIETRLMIHEEKGWQAYPYIWDESQTDAVLKVVGGEFEVQYVDLNGKDQLFNYLVPNKNQCKSCHNKNETMVPIGFQVKHLNNELVYGSSKKNQLDHLTALGKLEGFQGKSAHRAMVDYEDQSQALNDRAMAYLDINCAHCHSAEGPASTSGLFLSYNQRDPLKLGINKPPVAAGSGAGSFKFDIVPGRPDESILIHRMNSTQVGVAMPELGRTTVDQKGLELIKAWIAEMN